MISDILFGFYAILLVLFFLFLYYNTKQNISFNFELYSKLPLNQTWNIFNQSFKNSLFSQVWPQNLEKITSGGVETNAHLNITYTLKKLNFSKEYKFTNIVPNSEISYTTNSKQSFLGSTTIKFSTISTNLYAKLHSSKKSTSDNIFVNNSSDLSIQSDLNSDYNDIKNYQNNMKSSLFNSSSMQKLKQNYSNKTTYLSSSNDIDSKNSVTKITWSGTYTFRGFSLSAIFLSKLYNNYFFKTLQSKLDKL